MFIVGAVAIGLILLDHEHCDAEGAAARRGDAARRDTTTGGYSTK